MGIREKIVEELLLLSLPSEQLAYEKSLTNAGHAPTELIEVFCQCFDPKSQEFVSAFTRDEHRDLAHIYGLIVEASGANHSTVADMLKDPIWRRVVALAKELRTRFDSSV